jgi:hypothetical protein
MSTITLTDGTTTVTLPDDILWRDELDWSPVDQSVEYLLSGSLDIQVGTRLAGRPITLGGDESSSWMARGTILALLDWAVVAGQQLTLDYHGRSFAVIFRHQDAPAVDAKAVVEQVPPADEDWYWVTLKFMEV